MAELVQTAPAIGIALDNGRLSDAEAAAIHADGGDEPYYRERLAGKTMIVFN
ncbi:MAG: hypothetical protein JNL83_05580 [Myxococcales bacterium]|nr:hypothetical protein [Myxococcales bacterium]